MKDPRDIIISPIVSEKSFWENIFYFDRVKNKRVNQLPILPNVNISFKF